MKIQRNLIGMVLSTLSLIIFSVSLAGAESGIKNRQVFVGTSARALGWAVRSRQDLHQVTAHSGIPHRSDCWMQQNSLSSGSLSPPRLTIEKGHSRWG